MTSPSPTLAAVVLAARGGGHLADALAALAWADARVVLVVDGRDAGVLPPGVAALTDPRALADVDAGWLLVVAEGERLADGAQDTIRAALATGATDEVFAFGCVIAVLDLRVRLGHDLVRLAPRGSRLVLRPGLGLELARGSRRVRRLDVTLVRSGGTTLTEAVEQVGADGATLASLVDGGPRPRGGLLWHAAVAGRRALTARALGDPLGLGRWVLVVLESYRVVVAYAKLWERRRDRLVVVAG